jgi:outer membrane protein assembly factor BamB
LLLAIRKKDGTVAWKTELVKSTQAGPRTAHSTPVVWNGQIVLNRPGELSAYSPQDGARLWWFPTESQGTSSPTAGNGVLYVNAPGMGTDTYTLVKLPPFSDALQRYDRDKDGKLNATEAPANDLFFMKRGGIPDEVTGAHFTVKSFFRMIDTNQDGFVDEAEYNAIHGMMTSNTPAAAGILSIRPAGQGALAPGALQWSEPRGAPEVTTPLEYRGRVYAVNAGGIVSCMDAKTGKLIYRGRVNAPGAYYASPVAGGGKLFVASADGVVTVLGGGQTLEILANNDLSEPVYGTPALVESTIYIRSSRSLWAFGGGQ